MPNFTAASIPPKLFNKLGGKNPVSHTHLQFSFFKEGVEVVLFCLLSLNDDEVDCTIDDRDNSSHLVSSNKSPDIRFLKRIK